MEKQTYLTQEDFSELSNELELLRTDGRDDIAEKIKVARSFGDLSENAEYNEAMNEQAKLEARILKLEESLRHAQIIDEDSISTDKVHAGSRVKVLDLDYDEELEYKILGKGDPEKGVISDQSPVGAALIGAAVGDEVHVSLPSGEIRFKIIDISK